MCREALDIADPILLDYYAAWHARRDIPGIDVTPLGISTRLKQRGMWECAWDVVQLHFDQTRKREAAIQERLNKGDPACGLAILGQIFGSHALIRHYAQLSSAGDVYWEHREPILQFGGLGPLIMEPYESADNHNRWRQQVRDRMTGIPNTEPRYLEAFLLMRWFGEAHWDVFLQASRVSERRGSPFVDVLCELIEDSAISAYERGKLFEGATALLFSATPGFEVRSCAEQTTNKLT